eukprot:1317710-Amphidinium_carterae.2
MAHRGAGHTPNSNTHTLSKWYSSAANTVADTAFQRFPVETQECTVIHTHKIEQCWDMLYTVITGRTPLAQLSRQMATGNDPAAS